MVFLLRWLRNPNLQALSLHDIIEEGQVYQLVDAIDESELKSLHVSSSVLGEVAGETFLDVLATHPSISELTLQLDEDWESQGASIVALLSTVSTQN